MSEISRRKLIAGGLTAAAGVAGAAAGVRTAQHLGLIPPNTGSLYVPGDTLTYASQRLLTNHTLAREFSRSQISAKPFANGDLPAGDDFKRLEAGNFADWKLSIEGMVARPTTLSLAEIKSFPSRSQITHIACEEGWSYIAEWIGAPLSHVLDLAGVMPQARYVVYFSIQRGWFDSIDMSDALHPQTVLAHGMNGGELPVPFGGPLRMRVPRQLGYKNVKYIARLKVTDTLKGDEPQSDYSWYAGI